MNLNPYQNNLLSSYLEKSAAKPLKIRRPNGGNGNTLVARGNPKLGVIPTPINPTKAPTRPNFTLVGQPTTTRPIVPKRDRRALPLPGTSARNTGSFLGDRYSLSTRRDLPRIPELDIEGAQIYRDLVNGVRHHFRDVDIRNIQDYVGRNMNKLGDGVEINGIYYPGRNDISFNKPRGSRVVDAEVVGGSGGKPPVPPTSSVTAGIPGGGGKGPGMPGGKEGRPWYKNPWIIGGGAAGTLGAGGAALYNYASNAAKETTDAAPTPGGAPDNNSNNNTPTPNEAPESEGWWDSILEWVQENPELAMLILAGGGFAGGALLAR